MTTRTALQSATRPLSTLLWPDLRDASGRRVEWNPAQTKAIQQAIAESEQALGAEDDLEPIYGDDNGIEDHTGI